MIQREPERLLFNMRETCQMLGIANTTLWKLQKEGKIRPVRIGNAVRYTGDEIKRFLDALPTVPPGA